VKCKNPPADRRAVVISAFKPRALPAPVFGPTMSNQIAPERPSTRRGREPQKSPHCCRHTLPEAFGIRSSLDINWEGGKWRAADRSCASRCGHSSRRARGLGVAFVGALCRRIDDQRRRPAITELEDQQSAKSAGPKPWSAINMGAAIETTERRGDFCRKETCRRCTATRAQATYRPSKE
jgi:hypothetical protein